MQIKQSNIYIKNLSIDEVNTALTTLLKDSPIPKKLSMTKYSSLQNGIAAKPRNVISGEIKTSLTFPNLLQKCQFFSILFSISTALSAISETTLPHVALITFPT